MPAVSMEEGGVMARGMDIKGKAPTHVAPNLAKEPDPAMTNAQWMMIGVQ